LNTNISVSRLFKNRENSLHMDVNGEWLTTLYSGKFSYRNGLTDPSLTTFVES